MLAYLVPGELEAIEPGKRSYNWVWYRNAAKNRLANLLIDAGGRRRAFSTASAPPGQAAGRPVAEALPGTPTRLMRSLLVKSSKPSRSPPRPAPASGGALQAVALSKIRGSERGRRPPSVPSHASGSSCSCRRRSRFSRLGADRRLALLGEPLHVVEQIMQCLIGDISHLGKSAIIPSSGIGGPGPISLAAPSPGGIFAGASVKGLFY
jgi:hypothetical protein